MNKEKKLKLILSSLKEKQLVKFFQTFLHLTQSNFHKTIKQISFSCYESTCQLENICVNGYGKTSSQALISGINNVIDCLLEDQSHHYVMRESLRKINVSQGQGQISQVISQTSQTSGTMINKSNSRQHLIYTQKSIKTLGDSTSADINNKKLLTMSANMNNMNSNSKQLSSSTSKPKSIKQQIFEYFNLQNLKVNNPNNHATVTGIRSSQNANLSTATNTNGNITKIPKPCQSNYVSRQKQKQKIEIDGNNNNNSENSSQQLKMILDKIKYVERKIQQAQRQKQVLNSQLNTLTIKSNTNTVKQNSNMTASLNAMKSASINQTNFGRISLQSKKKFQSTYKKNEPNQQSSFEKIQLIASEYKSKGLTEEISQNKESSNLKQFLADKTNQQQNNLSVQKQKLRSYSLCTQNNQKPLVSSMNLGQNSMAGDLTKKIRIPKLNLEVLPNYHGKSNKSLNQSLMQSYENKANKAIPHVNE